MRRIARYPRSIVFCLAGLALLPPVAQAIGFGEMASQSAIGEPFRAEFKLFGVRSGEGSDCMRLVTVNNNDGIPQLRDGHVRLRTVGKQAFAVVTRAVPVSDPIIRVTLEETCSARLQRTYTLLLPMTATGVAASTSGQPTSSSAPRSTRRLGPEALGGTYALPRPASLNQLARELYPRSRTDRAAFIAALRKANVGDRSVRSSRRRLATGTTLVLPNPAEIAEAREAISARAREQARQARQQAAKNDAPTTPSPRPHSAPPPTPDTSAAATPAEAASADRLVIMGDTPAASGFKLSTRLSDPARIGTTTEAEREALRREQQLIMAMDSQIMARLELTDRIARLEALQNVLKAELASKAPDAKPGGDAFPDQPQQAAPRPVADSDATATRATQPAPVEPQAKPTARPAIETPTVPPEQSSDTQDWWPLLGGGLVVALIGALWWRRRSDADADAYDDELDALSRAHTARDEPPATTPMFEPPEVAHGQNDSFDFSVVEWDGPPPAELAHSIAPIALEEEEMAEEHESAVELADIMMSFGRVQGAAETLAEFIRGNPKKAVQPWIKLLEVYKAADMRSEFDALAHKLNQTFNVQSVTWAGFDDIKHAPDSVEQMPHIIDMLKNDWMTVDCQRYLQMLLRDNRGGTREGFPLGVVDDLLMLQAVLEDLLGPYRPTEEEIAAALSSSGTLPAASGDEGFVAPPADELAPDIHFDEPPPTPDLSAGDNDAETIELDSPATRTYLPDLDFQLDSGNLPELDTDFDAPEKKPDAGKKG